MTALRLKVGKIRATAPRYPSEAGFVGSINAQLKDLYKAVEDIVEQFEDASPPIMLEALRPTYAKSQIYCPIDTGALRASGYAEIAGTGKNPRVEIGYARGGNPYYAVYVHEMTMIFHKPPTRSKWLQAAVLEDLPLVHGRLVQAYQVFMSGGGV